MESLHAFNFRQWIDANRALLQPPVGNKRVFADGDFVIMVVGGPNARRDYHVDPGQEFFYQLEGDIALHVRPPSSDDVENTFPCRVRPTASSRSTATLSPCTTLKTPSGRPASLSSSAT